MSSTKGVVTVAAAYLVDRGNLELERPVAHYWPEFAAAGTARVTISQLLAPRAGVVTVPGYEDLLTPEGEGWDRTDEIVERLAAAEPVWPLDSAFGYHDITFRWLVGELIRRATCMSALCSTPRPTGGLPRCCTESVLWATLLRDLIAVCQPSIFRNIDEPVVA